MVTNFPLSFRPWVISDVCYIRSFPAFARSDFWHPKTWLGRAWWWLVSYLLAPLGAYLFSSVEAIPAYFDKRASITIRKSEETLEEGKNIVIFPENRTPFSPYNEDFSSGFIFTARRYYHKTGKRLLFYPVFCCKEQRVISVGKPIRYDPDQDFTSQRDVYKRQALCSPI